VHFVARTPPAALRATFRTSAVHFVARMRRGPVGATKCTRANQQFVARTTRPTTRATFVPYSQYFVARTTTAAMIATKRWLPGVHFARTARGRSIVWGF
jgi:hypothetical protein